jgi:small-conductance mechanosensitive channel
VLSDPAPLAMLTAFRGGNLALEIDFAIADPENGRQNLQSDVGIALYERFRANGIEIAVPRGDFQVSDESPVRAPAVRPDAHK